MRPDSGGTVTPDFRREREYCRPEDAGRTANVVDEDSWTGTLHLPDRVCLLVSRDTRTVVTRPELTAVHDGVSLTVHAQPNAQRTEIVGRHGDAVKIRLAAAPVDDRANEALIVLIATTFGLHRSDVSIRSGSSSRHKRLLLRGIAFETASAILDRHLRTD